jgi:hypothetical protein
VPDLRLAKLPDRTPIKIGIQVLPDLNEDLRRYADLYRQVYGETVAVPDLIPAMLSGFLESDREFVKSRKTDRKE